VSKLFSELGLDKNYIFSFHINPFYLRGDFDGDGEMDFAFLVIQNKTKKKGIAIMHSGSNKIFIVGAGRPCGNGGDDFRWMNIWSVYPRGKVELRVGKTTIPNLCGEALHVEKSGSASGLILWDGKKYVWYQQGD